MATVKFRLRTKTDNSPIYIRFSVSRSQVFETKTGYTIDHNRWSFEKKTINGITKIIDAGKPKQNNADNKIIAGQLRELEDDILNTYNEDLSNGIEFSTDWLKKVIAVSQKRDIKPMEENDDLFSVYLKEFISVRKLDGRTRKSTDQKFVQLQKKITDFEKKKRKKLKIADFDKRFMLEFRQYLIDNFNYMESSANRTLKNVKTVLLDARDNGKTINHQINSFRIETVPAVKVFLDFAEIQKIKDAKIIGSELVSAKDWLIIGCYTGQRVSDLLRMNKGMISTKIDSKGKKYEVIELTQEKTGKEVSIPLHPEVSEILKKYNGEFPPTFGKAKDSNFVLFNRHIKTVCELAEINTVVKGRLFNYDEAVKRNEIVNAPKHKFVTSHICRRSFATNFYGDKRFTTPQIMAITGHKTESVFLSYIGKTSDDFALKTAETFREIAEQKKKTS